MTVVLKDVRKRYGRHTVVGGVDLSVSPGEIVGLLGPNGAGKTTTFYTATGLVKPDVGSVWLGARNITPLPLERRSRLGIGYLPQQPSIFRHMSVGDNLRLALEHSRVPRSERRERLHELLAEFDLAAIARRQSTQVSGGERRRTELARALATDRRGPRFLLLDEPFAGVDPIAVTELQATITRLRERGIGMLLTDHNVRETLAIVDRAYILKSGEVLAAGTASELYRNPLVRQYYLGESFQP
ncbi:MAG: LPS export ABC transporter ATP-binding protein [Cyanobacteria bacterium QS_8_64_29]|nr:MAG: LPS export ABC transporter ATP-binding protein [Cyanobacteria bacterium QS_8_64_29]